MTINSEQIQALKAAAEKAIADDWGYDRDEFSEIASPEAILSLLAEREADKALIAELKPIAEHAQRGWQEAHEQEALVERAMTRIDEQAKSIDFLKEQLAQLANFNPDWDKLEAAYDSLREHMTALTAAQNRIAELEASLKAAENNEIDALCHIAELQDRTLTVKLPRDITHVTNKYFEEGRDAVIEAIESQLAAAGITLVVGE